jgi:hypothetical protein
MAREFTRQTGLGLAVYRPSIVYGHSRNGRSLSFNAVYYPVRMVLFLKKIYEKDILEKGGEKAAALAIHKDGGGLLHLPLRIEVGSQGGINLVRIDFFVDAFCALMARARDGDIFHIVSDEPKPIAEIIDHVGKQFGLTGFRPCRPEEFIKGPKNGLEQLFALYGDLRPVHERRAQVHEGAFPAGSRTVRDRMPAVRRGGFCSVHELCDLGRMGHKAFPVIPGSAVLQRYTRLPCAPVSLIKLVVPMVTHPPFGQPSAPRHPPLEELLAEGVETRSPRDGQACEVAAAKLNLVEWLF